MRPATTITLACLTLGLLAFVLLYERHEDDSHTRAAKGEITFLFDPDSVTTARLQGAEGRLLFQLRPPTPTSPNPSWWVSDPYEDRANPATTSALVAAVASLAIEDSIPIPADPQARAKLMATYGLGEGAFDFKLSDAAENTIADIRIGSQGPYPDSCYVQPEVGPHIHAVLLVRPDLRTALEVPIATHRDPALLRGSPLQVYEVTLADAEGEIHLSREDSGALWQMSRPLLTRGHRERIDALLHALYRAEIEGVIDSATGTISGAEAPARLITLLVDPNPPDPETSPILPDGSFAEAPAPDPSPRDLVEISLQVAISPAGDVTARSSERPDTLLLPSSLAPLLDSQVNELRDAQLAQLDLASLHHIVIRPSARPPIQLRRIGPAWQLWQNATWSPSSPRHIDQLVKGINQQPILAFVSDSAADLAPFGLDAPHIEVTFSRLQVPDPSSGADGGDTTTPDGQPYPPTPPPYPASATLQIAQDPQGRFTARFLHEPFIYGVGSDILNLIPPQAERWRSLRVLSFSPLSLRSISRQDGATPPLIVSQNRLSEWAASLANNDVSALLDPRRADALASILSSFEADRWATDRAPAVTALQDPELTILISLQNPADPEPTTQQLTFAPSVPGAESLLYYGRLGTSQEIFLISREKYKLLRSSLFDPDKVALLEGGLLELSPDP